MTPATSLQSVFTLMTALATLRQYLVHLFVFVLKDFIYLFERDREREKEQEWWGRTEGEGEADSLLRREPNVGLDPRTPGSWPEPKADAQPLSHPGGLASFVFSLSALKDCASISIFDWEGHQSFLQSPILHNSINKSSISEPPMLATHQNVHIHSEILPRTDIIL